MGYFFALFSPFLDSILNYVDKFLLSKYDISPTILALYSGIFAFLSGIVVYIFIGLRPIDMQSAFIIIISGFLSFFILSTYFKALTYDEASRVASLFQLGRVMSLALGFVFLGEILTSKQYLGSFFIIISGVLLTVRRLKSGIFHINKSFWYMVLSCTIIAVSALLFKIGASEVGFWEAIPYEGIGNGLASLVVAVSTNSLSKLRHPGKIVPKRVFLYLSLSEMIYKTSRLSFYFAVILLPLSITSLLQGFQPVFLLIESLILTLWFPEVLREVVTERTIALKLIAVVGIFIGLYLIFL